MLFASILFSLGVGGFSLLGSAEEADNASKPEIDVWLIAGQSNAVGFGSDGLSQSYLEDKRYTEGFEDVLFYGNYQSTYNPETFVPVTVGLGRQKDGSTTTVGAEIGMAAALSGSGRMNAIIKHAQGASYLYPTTDGSVSVEHGTWTPPTYIEEEGISTEGNKIGDLYEGFLATVSEGLAMLKEDYTPVIRGVWWMQGEAETPNELHSFYYEDLLRTLISDMKRDLGKITSQDMSNLPFVMGKITRNPEYNDISSYPGLDTVNAAQVNVTSSVANTAIVDTTGLTQLDGWHYSADSQHYIGEEFIKAVTAMSGKFSVTIEGVGVNMSGGGAKEKGSAVTVTFTPFEGYNLTSVKMKVGSAESTDITASLDSANSYTFTMPEDNVIFEAVATDPNAESTKYGTIPTKYKDAATYPFILFKDGKFLYAYEEWHTFVNTCAVSEATVLMRRNYNTTESGSFPWAQAYLNDITLDLGGFTLTRGTQHIFQALSKGTITHTPRFTVTNGTLKTEKSAIIAFNNSTDSTVIDKFEFIFDGITIDVSNGRGIVTSYDGGTIGQQSKVVLNNCTIVRGSSTSATALFHLLDNKDKGTVLNKNDIEIIINGGKLTASTANSLNALVFAAFDEEREAGLGSPDSLTFAEGSDGSTITMELPVSEAAPTAVYKFMGGYYTASKLSDNGTTAIYTFAQLPEDRVTPYGVIETQYASINDYPFVVFNGGKNIHGFSDWKTFINAGFNTADYQTGCTVYLRKNYSTTEASGDAWAISYFEDLVIDLGGNTLTRENWHLFQANGHGANDDTTLITVKNGTLKSSFHKADGTTAASPLIVYNTDPNSTSSDIINFFLDGITLDVSSGRGIVACYGNGTASTKGTVTLNNCTINRGDKTSSMTLFALSDSSGNKHDVSVVINGGKLTASSLSNLTFATYSDARDGEASSPDGLVIGKSSEGEDFTFVLPTGIAQPMNEFVLSDGTYFASELSDNGTESCFKLEKLSALKMSYGDIKLDYASTVDYPFVVFKGGENVYGFGSWGYFFNKVITKSDYEHLLTGCTVYLRRDYSTSDDAESHAWGTHYIKDMVFDLCGNTLTRGSKHLFQALGRIGGTSTEITVKNGKLDVLSKTLIAFNNQTTAGASISKFDFVFDNVTIDVSRGKNIIACYDGGVVGTQDTVTIKNSVIVRGNTSSDAVMFSLKDTSANKNDVAVTLENTSITASSKNSIDTLVLVTYDDARGDITPDSLTVVGEVMIVLPSGQEKPSAVFNVSGKEYILKPSGSSEDGKSDIYSLINKAIAEVDFAPKSSITLDSDLIYNIYIPAGYKINSVKLDGEDIDLTAITPEGGYYVYSKPLKSFEAGKTMLLTVELDQSGTAIKGSFSLSVPTYAKAILEGSASEAEKTLALDVLAYVKSAYSYFENAENKDKVIEEIDSVLTLGGYTEAEFTKVSGESNIGEGLRAVTFILDATPTIRFYLTANAEDYTFSEAVVASGRGEYMGETYDYVDISVYAYRMIGVIRYDTNDGKSGSYHINSYVDYVNGDQYTESDKAELSDLTEKFYNYCKSAEAYREYVKSLAQ